MKMLLAISRFDYRFVCHFQSHRIFFFLFLVSWRRFFCAIFVVFNVLSVFRRCCLNRKTVWKKNSSPSYKIQQFSTVFNSFVCSDTFIRTQRVDFLLLFFHAYTIYIYISYSQLYTFYANTFFELIMNKEGKKTKKKMKK